MAARKTRLGHAVGQVVRIRPAQLGPRAEGQSGSADEGDSRAVGRPGRARVAVHRRSQVGDARVGGVVNADEAVIAAVAHESEPAGVGRPDRAALAAEDAEERPVGFDRHHPWVDRCPVDRAVLRVGDPFAVRRQRHVPGLDDAPGLATRRADRPHRALGATRVAGRVRDPAFPVGRVTAQKDQRGAVVRDAQVREIAPVVVLVAREPRRLEVRRRSRVDVAPPLLVFDPGDPVGRLRRDELDGVAGTEHILDREALGLRGQGSERRKGEGGEGGSGERENGKKGGTALHGCTPAFRTMREGSRHDATRGTLRAKMSMIYSNHE